MVIAVAVIAISVSAYKSVETAKEQAATTLNEVPFYHMGDGLYKREAPPQGTNCAPDPLTCTITYLDESDVENIEEFTLPNQPAGQTSESGNGVWE